MKFFSQTGKGAAERTHTVRYKGQDHSAEVLYGGCRRWCLHGYVPDVECDASRISSIMAEYFAVRARGMAWSSTWGRGRPVLPFVHWETLWGTCGQSTRDSSSTSMLQRRPGPRLSRFRQRLDPLPRPARTTRPKMRPIEQSADASEIEDVLLAHVP